MSLKKLLRSLYALEIGMNENEISQAEFGTEMAKETFKRMAKILGFIFDINWKNDINLVDLMYLQKDERDKEYHAQRDAFEYTQQLIRDDLKKCAFLYYYAILLFAIGNTTETHAMVKTLKRLFEQLPKSLHWYKKYDDPKTKEQKSNENKHELLVNFYNKVLVRNEQDKIITRESVPEIISDCFLELKRASENKCAAFSVFQKICLNCVEKELILFEQRFTDLKFRFDNLMYKYLDYMRENEKLFKNSYGLYDKIFSQISTSELNMIKYIYELDIKHNHIISNGESNFRDWNSFTNREKAELAKHIDNLFSREKDTDISSLENIDINIDNLYFKYFGVDTKNNTFDTRSWAKEKLNNLLADLNGDVLEMLYTILDQYKEIKEHNKTIDDSLYDMFEARVKSLYKISERIYDNFITEIDMEFSEMLYKILSESK